MVFSLERMRDVRIVAVVRDHAFGIHGCLVRRGFGAGRGLLVSDALRAIGGHLRIERRRRVGLAPLAGNLGVFVLVLGVARRASRLFDVGADQRDHHMVGQPPFTRTIVVQNVTKPKLALLHLRSREIHWQGKFGRKAIVF